MIKSVNQREFMAQTSFSLDLNKKTSPEHCGRNNKFVPTNNAPGGPPLHDPICSLSDGFYWGWLVKSVFQFPSGYFIYVNYSFMYNLNVLKNVLKILSYS